MKTMNIFLGTIEGVKNFVNTVCKLDCDVDIASGRYVIDAKSDGEDAEKAAALLQPFAVEE